LAKKKESQSNNRPNKKKAKGKLPYNAYVARNRQEKFFKVKKTMNKWNRQKKHLYSEAGVELPTANDVL